MSDSMKTALHAVQYLGFIGAQITNSVLLFLIFTRAERLFGSYRHVMSVFAFYSLIYTWIEVLTQPIMHIKGPAFIVMMDSFLKYDTWIGNELTCLYCGSFALCIALLAAQFYYRYIAVCNPDHLMKIKGGNLVLIFIPCIVAFVSWTACVYYGMHNEPEKQEYLKEVIMEYYGEDTSKTSFIAPMYWSIDEHGSRVWRLWDVMGSVGCTLILVLCFFTIMFCATRIHRKLMDAQNIMSAKTKELNRQLFITLTLQTVLPFVMMYSPVGLILTLPFFEADIGRMANFCGASAAIYPSLEPLIAIFCIRDFRNAILCRTPGHDCTTCLIQANDVALE